MSTPSAQPGSSWGALRCGAASTHPTRFGSADPAESLALVVRAKREALLRAHRHSLGFEDLEDCYGQATLELLRSLEQGRAFADREHLANALEQRFVSRVRDELRAIRGRSPARAAHRAALGRGAVELEIADERADVERLAERRADLEELLRVALRSLTRDQRLVLSAQVAGVGRAELCRHADWSFEKYRKVAQRGRARLRDAMSAPANATFGATSHSPRGGRSR